MFCTISDTKNYVTTQPGANYGLRLVLWVNQSDAYIIGSPAAGFRVGLEMGFCLIEFNPILFYN